MPESSAFSAVAGEGAYGCPGSSRTLKPARTRVAFDPPCHPRNVRPRFS
ncbi:hypothetical protein [Lysobacter gummosus]